MLRHRNRSAAVGLIASLTWIAGFPAGASAQTVQYGPLWNDFAVVHPGGPSPLLLLHEAGETYAETEAIATAIARQGQFTVLNIEWQAASGKQIWGFDTGQIEEAVRYVRAKGSELGVDPAQLAMLGGSRGANLALLTSMNMDAVAPGTVRVIASLSGDANPAKQIERGQRGELDPFVGSKLSKVYGCKPVLVECPADYVAEWSPVDKASATAPAMILAASETERKTASLVVSTDQVGSLEQSSDRGLVAESRVSSVMVVVPQPSVKGCCALRAVAVDPAVGPASEHRSDEALAFPLVCGR